MTVRGEWGRLSSWKSAVSYESHQFRYVAHPRISHRFCGSIHQYFLPAPNNDQIPSNRDFRNSFRVAARSSILRLRDFGSRCIRCDSKGMSVSCCRKHRWLAQVRKAI